MKKIIFILLIIQPGMNISNAQWVQQYPETPYIHLYDVKFEIIDVVTLEDEREFLIVAEADRNEDDDVEVTILEIKEVDGEEVYDTVTDEDLGKKVFDEFTKNQDDLEDME